MAQSQSFISSALAHKRVRVIGGGLLAVLAITFIGTRMNTTSNSGVNQIASSTADKNTKDTVIARTEINQSIDIPTGKDDSVITYQLVDAEINSEITADGERYFPKEGKQFLILNLKLSNDSENRVAINTRDYVRLDANNQGDRLPPAFFNELEVLLCE